METRIRHGDIWPLMEEQPIELEAAAGLTGPGFFGKMFDLLPFSFEDAALQELAQAMDEGPTPDEAGDNPAIPAGFTYFGQFVDHDITFDVFSGPVPVPADLQPMADGQILRTPSLDLDSIYGGGPKSDHQLYEKGVQAREARFRIGRTRNEQANGVNGICIPNDLPRDDRISDGSENLRATIGDPRNDENLVVAQMHVAFLKFHNKVLDLLAKDKMGTYSQHGGRHSRFERAQELVRWHYQWIVLHDFVRRLVMPAVLDDVFINGRKFYRFEDTPPATPFMPVEFAVAAYRLGHSMIREVYDYNRVFKRKDNPQDPALVPASLQLLFRFTGSDFPNDPPGRAPIPGNWIIDWRRFFEVDANLNPNLSRKLDTKLAPQLANLPAFVAQTDPQKKESPMLAHRNLFRGRQRELPSGQDVADHIGVSKLTSDELASGPEGQVVRKHGFDQRTPLWFYILKEAEVKGRGIRLGPVGSRIVSEVFVGLLEGDPTSYLARNRQWRPSLPAAVPGDFTMADLLRFVGEINPIGQRPEDTAEFDSCPH